MLRASAAASAAQFSGLAVARCKFGGRQRQIALERRLAFSRASIAAAGNPPFLDVAQPVDVADPAAVAKGPAARDQFVARAGQQLRRAIAPQP